MESMMFQKMNQNVVTDEDAPPIIRIGQFAVFP